MAAIRTQALRRLLSLQGQLQALRAPSTSSLNGTAPSSEVDRLKTEVDRLQAQVQALSKRLEIQAKGMVLKRVFRDKDGQIEYVVDSPVTEDELTELLGDQLQETVRAD